MRLHVRFVTHLRRSVAPDLKLPTFATWITTGVGFPNMLLGPPQCSLDTQGLSDIAQGTQVVALFDRFLSADSLKLVFTRSVGQVFSV